MVLALVDANAVANADPLAGCYTSTTFFPCRKNDSVPAFWNAGGGLFGWGVRYRPRGKRRGLIVETFVDRPDRNGLLEELAAANADSVSSSSLRAPTPGLLASTPSSTNSNPASRE